MSYETLTEQTWLVSHEDFREDLWWFQLALDLGFTAKTQGPVVNGLPTDDIYFVLGDTFIWKATYYGTWYARDMQDAKWKLGCREYDNLKEALETEASKGD